MPTCRHPTNMNSPLPGRPNKHYDSSCCQRMHAWWAYRPITPLSRYMYMCTKAGLCLRVWVWGSQYCRFPCQRGKMEKSCNTSWHALRSVRRVLVPSHGRAHLDITFGCSVCVMLDAPDLRRTGGGERGISWAGTAGIRGLGSSLTSGLRACFGIPSPTAFTTVATSSRAAELELSVVLLMGLGTELLKTPLGFCQEAQCTYSSGCNANSMTSLVWWFTNKSPAA